MKQLATALALALGLASPSLAQVEYIIQQPTDTNATRDWPPPASSAPTPVPVPGTNCPPGSHWCIWVVQNGDRCLSHYKIDSSNNEIYAVPVPPPPPPPQPNPLAAEQAILADPAISEPAKLELMKLKSVLDNYLLDPVGVSKAWGIIKATDSQITAEDAAEVEADCAKQNMTLKQ